MIAGNLPESVLLGRCAQIFRIKPAEIPEHRRGAGRRPEFTEVLAGVYQPNLAYPILAKMPGQRADSFAGRLGIVGENWKAVERTKLGRPSGTGSGCFRRGHSSHRIQDPLPDRGRE